MEFQQVLSSKFALLTFNPHPSEQEVLNDFHNLFFPLISSKSKYCGFSTEKEGTTDRHIHYIFSCPDSCSDISKVKARVFVKPIKQFQKYLKDSAKLTIINDNNTQALNYKYVKDTNEDKMKTIGYCFKDNSSNRSTETFSEDFITQCVKFYYANRKIDKSKVSTDWDLITPKNVYTKLPQVSKEKNIDLYGHNLLYSLSKSKVGIANISPKQLKTAYIQLKIAEYSQDEEKNSNLLVNSSRELNDEYDWHILNDDELIYKNKDHIEKLEDIIKKQTQEIFNLTEDLKEKDKAYKYWRNKAESKNNDKK